ncbi:MAG: hypothetical protein JWM33_1036, partial [Caulobacteraceae bacterium]|nr:hypothetical protein [Caulobacteraceae bacterium]
KGTAAWPRSILRLSGGGERDPGHKAQDDAEDESTSESKPNTL